MLVTELCRVPCLTSLGCLFWARCHMSIGSAGSNSAPLRPVLRAKIYITIKMGILFNGEMKPNCKTKLPTSFLSFFFFCHLLWQYYLMAKASELRAKMLAGKMQAAQLSKAKMLGATGCPRWCPALLLGTDFSTILSVTLSLFF